MEEVGHYQDLYGPVVECVETSQLIQTYLQLVAVSSQETRSEVPFQIRTLENTLSFHPSPLMERSPEASRRIRPWKKDA